MSFFQKKTLEERNKDLSEKKHFSMNEAYSSYKEKQAARATARKAYNNSLTKQKDVENDYKHLGRGAAAGLSGGSLYGHMVRRKR